MFGVFNSIEKEALEAQRLNTLQVLAEEGPQPEASIGSLLYD
jgi:hypothetical protein